MLRLLARGGVGRVGGEGGRGQPRTYADGAAENLGMINMIAMGASPAWRVDIGTDINPATGPSPAASAPSS